MRKFLKRHQEEILGVLSGFDRMRFRGSLLMLQSEPGVVTWLANVGVTVKAFLSFAEAAKPSTASGPSSAHRGLCWTRCPGLLLDE